MNAQSKHHENGGKSRSLNEKSADIAAPTGRPHIIILGNEKGGSGKSTTAMHIVVGLLREGYKVGIIDLDSRQKSLARYIENRETFTKDNDVSLPMPLVRVVERSKERDLDKAEAQEKAAFEAAYVNMSAQVHAIVVDCPGSDTYLSRLAHTAADTLLTPLNDSFVDMDLLASVDWRKHKVITPSLYAEMVWKARQRRASVDGAHIDWVVMRNRIGSLHAKNKDRVQKVLEELSKRIGMRFITGLGERVIYRELFLRGLTLLDLRDVGGLDGRGLSMSNVAARQEIRALLDDLQLPFRNKGAQAVKKGTSMEKAG